uniref:AsmA-like C-terminal region-containing protein n=1 Tax=Falsiroseomonas oryzae TaxID=2766473 RepID=UPI0022EAC436
WRVALRGQVLDLRRKMADDTPAGPAAAEPGPAVAVEGRFDRVLIGPDRELAAVDANVQVDGRGVLRQGRLTGRAGPRGPFEASITPQGQGRALRLTAEDAGALLHAFGVLRHLEGGRLSVMATYAHDAPGAPLSGTAEMTDFAVHNAPAFGKLLQAMTLYGLLEAMSGPGLGFSRLVAPFTLTPDTLTLSEARAFSASLGLTAKGTLDRRRQHLSMEGTIVPAYVFNSLLGNIPILGRLFSPEQGGGVFAATWRLQGPQDDPQVSVNPLAALTPGFLRGLFGIGQQPAP